MDKEIKDTYTIDIATLIKEAREENKITQAELSRMIKVNRSTVNRWESGETTPTIKHLRMLDKLLNINIDYNEIFK